MKTGLKKAISIYSQTGVSGSRKNSPRHKKSHLQDDLLDKTYELVNNFLAKDYSMANSATNNTRKETTALFHHKKPTKKTEELQTSGKLTTLLGVDKTKDFQGISSTSFDVSVFL